MKTDATRLSVLMDKYQSVTAEEENSLQEKNNLDKYFDDIYTRIQFRLDKEQIDDIERKVENIVSEIVEGVLKESRSDVDKLLEYIGNVFHSLKIAEKNAGGILKVGSFYERTKNTNLNEFDFIFVLGRFKCYQKIDSYIYFNNEIIHDKIRKFLAVRRVGNEFFIGHRRPKMDHKTRVQYVGQRGPSTKFRIGLYGTNIYIDLVPAVMVSGIDNISGLNTKLQCPVGFKDEIDRTGSFLLVNGRLSFTQTEVHFMKHVLSPKHKYVYRLCKYLINGSNSYSELVRRQYRSASLWEFQKGFISTYMIKTEIIFHHYECTSVDSSEAECVLKILRKLLNIVSGEPVLSLTDTSRRPLFYKDEERYSRLKRMITHLERLQKSSKDYEFRKCHVSPLNKHLFRLSQRPPPRYTRSLNEVYVCCLNDKIATVIIIVLIIVVFIVLYFVL